MNLHGIEIDTGRLAAFCHERGISSLRLFGSILRDDFGPDSDIDVLVEFAPGRVPGLAFFQIQEELAVLFGRKVDLHTPGFLSPYFRQQVLDEAEVLYDAA